ncbi:short-chain dehydrogenase [Insulibacter thermoxylanivorax]|uniref:Short-chain dehydrogenase n=1 Tax=Insulibacter thermoxylanivorax TaxID=2749268 RepID=A0A916QEJ0_9BACL|nr:SDR family oxidoreductase [Insulibacter thermoxylanivorax]GFR39045.1 short-chain dehydrogenase [Insulibacter thermoxylanivorax]
MLILITGANRGLGLALAKTALERGHTVLAGVRSLERADRLRELQAVSSDQIVLLQLDVQDEESIRQAAAKIEQDYGKLDVIINNAAILIGRDSKLEELDIGLVEESMDVNLYGPMRVVKHMLPLVHKNGKGCILNISSEAGSFHNAYGGDYPYALSKAALNYFTQQLHKDLSSKGIRALAVHPGWMRTDMGGSSAHLDPMETAAALLDLLESKKEAETEPFAFVDYTGRAFPI